MNQTQLFVSRSEIGDRKVDLVEARAFCKIYGIPFAEFVQQLEEELGRLEQE